MSKSTYFTGQPVYSQVIKLLDKAKFLYNTYFSNTERPQKLEPLRSFG